MKQLFNHWYWFNILVGIMCLLSATYLFATKDNDWFTWVIFILSIVNLVLGLMDYFKYKKHKERKQS